MDFLENGTIPEFEEFVRRFQDRGFNCQICDIRTLKYEDGVLYSKEGYVIDAIYRRAVTSDIMADLTSVSDFINAVKNNDVFIAGPILTEIVHNKWFFYVLHHNATKNFLTEEDNRFIKEHIPLTVEFSKGYIAFEEVVNKKDEYIIKPKDAYASKGVYLPGFYYSKQEWKTEIEKIYNKGYICQQFCHPPVYENIDFSYGSGEWEQFNQMTGLYSFNGKLGGILMRTANIKEKLINSATERVLPVFCLDN